MLMWVMNLGFAASGADAPLVTTKGNRGGFYISIARGGM